MAAVNAVNSYGNAFPWGRKIQVRFFEMTPTGEIGYPLKVVCDGLRTTVDYTVTWSCGNDSCIVEIYNMSPEIEIALRQYQTKLAIQVYAGYIGTISTGIGSSNTSATSTSSSKSALDTDVGILFTGIVNTLYSRKEYTEHVTTFMCIPKSSKWYMKDVKYKTKGKDVRQVIEGLAAKAGWTGTQGEPLVKYHQIPNDLLSRVYGSITFEGSFADCIGKVADQTQLQVSGRMDGLHVYMQGKIPAEVASSSGFVKYENTLAKVEADSVYYPNIYDLKSLPIRTDKMITMNVRFRPLMFPGVVIDASALAADEVIDASGKPIYMGGLIDYKGMSDVIFRQNIFKSYVDTTHYLCQGARHTLDTHGDDWNTQINASSSVASISDPATHYFDLNAGRY